MGSTEDGLHDRALLTDGGLKEHPKMMDARNTTGKTTTSKENIPGAFLRTIPIGGRVGIACNNFFRTLTPALVTAFFWIAFFEVEELGTTCSPRRRRNRDRSRRPVLP
jgi:hypothetical protein